MTNPTLLSALEQLKANGPSDPAFGICRNVARYLPPSYTSTRAFARDLYALFDSWPLNTGVAGYPVPCTGHYKDPAEQYWSDPNKWVGEQGVLWRSLLDHCINQLKK